MARGRRGRGRKDPLQEFRSRHVNQAISNPSPISLLNPPGLSPLLVDSTTLIEVTYEDGSGSTGTGFFFDYLLPQNHSLHLLVTNKHVVEQAITGSFELHIVRVDDSYNIIPGPRETVRVSLPDFENRWIPHPRGVDLSALNYTPEIVQDVRLSGPVALAAASSEMVFSDDVLMELRTVEDVIMAGYPRGLWDSVNKVPFIRRGSTAIHPALDFEGRSLGMVDMSCFPGSSGSPIFILNDGIYRFRENPLDLKKRVILLGVLVSGPKIMMEGQIIRGNATEEQSGEELYTMTPVMMNLGNYIKAKEILILAEHVRVTLGIS